MSHQDRTNSVYLAEVLQWLLRGVRVECQLSQQCSWTWDWFIKTALLWAWSAETSLTERFRCAQRLTVYLQGEQAKARTSWQAFIEMACRHTAHLRIQITHAFRQRMEHDFSGLWTLAGFVVLGVDGSQIDVARSASNEAAFSAKKSEAKRCRRQKKGNKGADKRSGVPQILMTTLFHVRLNMPWNWRIGARGDSERGQLRDMLSDLPENCLLTADAGFVGYDLAAAILASGAELVIRVGNNIQLLSKLGPARERHGLVYLWPEKAARKKRKPLVFRLVEMQGPRHPIFLLTSVVSGRRLSDKRVVEIYRSRWGIEVYHRHLKQTYGRRKLLSLKAEHARVELEWSLLGFWGMNLYATAELTKHEIPLQRLSIAGLLRAIRRMARDYAHPANHEATLRAAIRKALIDTYQRTNKNNRGYAIKKKHTTAGKPRIKKATQQQQLLAAILKT